MKEEFKINVVKNKSTTYMLPFVNEQVNFKFQHQLVNSYLSFVEGDDVFCVMYDWVALPDFLKFEGEMMDHHLYVGHEDYGSKTVYKFRLSRHMKAGRDSFINGKYDEFSQEHKDSIIKHLIDIGATNVQRISDIMSTFAVLSSTPPDMEREVFMNNVKKLTIIPENFEYEGN